MKFLIKFGELVCNGWMAYQYNNKGSFHEDKI